MSGVHDRGQDDGFHRVKSVQCLRVDDLHELSAAQDELFLTDKEDGREDDLERKQSDDHPLKLIADLFSNLTD